MVHPHHLCFELRDAEGEVIYVGKAKNLRSRISSYYPGSTSTSPAPAGWKKNKPWIAKGPSGTALRSLVEFVKGWSA